MPLPFLQSNIWLRLWRPVRADLACLGFRELDHALPADVRRFVCNSYPRNHTYAVGEDRLAPHRKLAERVVEIERHYPSCVSSLVDLSCSKGFFVFRAAQRATCERALGIDLNDECLDACRRINDCNARAPHARFARQRVDELAERIDDFGGPFQTALLINTYQYLFFGSGVAPALSHDHRKIFQWLRTVCTGRLIFHNRSEAADVQRSVAESGEFARHASNYNGQAIRRAASEFFRLTDHGPRFGFPLWTLDARC